MNDDLPRVYHPLSVLDELREQRILDNDETGIGGEGSDRAYHWGRMSERDAIVAWLRGQAEMTYNNTNAYHALWLAAEAVEHGKHRREEEP